jgi:hypothetical protein
MKILFFEVCHAEMDNWQQAISNLVTFMMLTLLVAAETGFLK